MALPGFLSVESQSNMGTAAKNPCTSMLIAPPQQAAKHTIQTNYNIEGKNSIMFIHFL